jgi:hypothetical protein
MIASDPEYGDVMPGTGGFRKVRVGREGMGKRGGARVIYILRNENFPISSWLPMEKMRKLT